MQNHFFFLKVGPELTFRLREAVWALTRLEDQIGREPRSRLRDVVAERMTRNPVHWQDYYSGSEVEIEMLKIYSYSDRIRYYWADPQVAKAMTVLMDNLSESRLPETLVSQAFMGLEFGAMPSGPSGLLETHVQRCVSRYFQAAGFPA